MARSNRVVHFEIPTDDPEKSINFFKSIFGWEFEKFGDQDYWMVKTGESSTPGIDGAIMKKRDKKQPLVNAIDVEDIDQSAKKIEKAGGKIVVPKAAVPTMGWFCYFTDTDGNIHGLWQTDENAR